jgi:hypothetical protein
MDIKEIVEELNKGEMSQKKFSEEILGIPEGTLRSRIKKAGYIRNDEKQYILDENFVSRTAEQFNRMEDLKKSVGKNSNELRVNSREFASNNKIKNSSLKNKNNAIIDNKNKNKNKNKDDDMELEIQALIKGTNKEESNRVYKGVYLDKDIAHFLDTIQHGNKSEVINKIIRKYLLDNDLL